MRYPLTTLLVIIAVVSAWYLAPQYWGATETVREPVLEGIGNAGLYDTDWEEPASASPNFRTNCSVSTFSNELAEEGLTRNPLAMQHYVGDEHADASWAFRNRSGADYQTHVTLFETENGTDIYVHREWNYLRHPIKHHNNPDNMSFNVSGPDRFEQILTDNPNRLSWNVRNALATDVSCSLSRV